MSIELPAQMKTPAPLPQLGTPFAEQPLTILMAQVLWGEGRSTRFDGMLAIGHSIKNRVGYNGKYGNGFAGVILKPWQYDVFNEGDPNREKMMEPTKWEPVEVWEAAYAAATLVLNGSTADPTGRAVFYFTAPRTEVPRKHDGSSAWGCVVPTVVIEGIHFHREGVRGEPGAIA